MTFDLTGSLAADPAPTRFAPVGSPVTMATFDPTGNRLIGTAGWSGPMMLVDGTTGAAMTATGLPSGNTSFPVWSPDGAQIAYMGNVGLGAEGHPLDADIFVLDRVSDDPPAFGGERMIHDGASLAGAPEGGTTDSHPVFSPDGALLAFQHGVRTFSFISGTSEVPPSALYAMRPDGSGLVRLDNANGGPGGTSAYWPAYTPYVTDEADGHRYYWLAFYSRRDYGNAIAGTQGADRRQLWVAAIDADAPPGLDPSFVPYWLPGQSTLVRNVSPYWAPEPCRATGTGCATSAECCTERCELGPDDTFSCTPPPPAECRPSGATCGSDADCCDGATCIGNRCYAGPS
jgi:hypothetical protein